MAVNKFSGKSVAFTDLPKEVQDTVLYWVGQMDSINAEYYEPYIICFDEQYTLKSEFFGPWVKYKLLTRISDGKKYKLKRNTPCPVIVRNDTIIIPDDYNILWVWKPSVKWKMYRLR